MPQFDRYVVRSTGAFVTLQDAVRAVNEYVQRLPHDRWCEEWRPRYRMARTSSLTKVFECSLTLPEARRGCCLLSAA